MRDWGLLEYAWWGLTFLAALLTWAAQVPPKQVLSNVAEWAIAFGARNPPDWLKSPNADRFVRHGACLTLTVLGTMGFFLFFDAGNMRLGPKITLVLGSLTICVAIVWNYVQPATVALPTTPTIGPPSQAPSITLDHSLLMVFAVATMRTHDPIRVSFFVMNAGKLPTTKVIIRMDHKIVDREIPLKEIDERFVEVLTLTKTLSPQDTTLLPQQQMQYSLQSPLVTKDVLEEVRAGKKGVYALFSAVYRDISTPPNKHIVTELAVRSSALTHAEAPLREWSVVVNRSYLSD